MPIAQFLSMAEYRTHSGINISSLKLMKISAAHCKWALDHPRESSDAQDFGNMVDAGIFEPEKFETEFVAAPDCDRRTKIGKDTYGQFVTNNLGKVILTPDDFERAKATIQAVKASRFFSLLNGGQAQLSCFWDEQDVKCKGRPDYVKDNILVDLKTTGKLASPNSWYNELNKYGYVNQLAWYRRGLEANGIAISHALLFVVESNPPHGVVVYRIPDDTLKLACNENRELLRSYVECKQTGIWPGYPEVIHDIDIPTWAKTKMEAAYGSEL